MRVVLFAKSKRRTRTTGSIASALRRAGHATLAINHYKRRRWFGRSLALSWTLASVRRFRPDLVFIHAKDLHQDVFEGLGGALPTLMFTPDCHASPLRLSRLPLAGRVDLLCTVAKGQVEEFERAGVKRAAYLAEAHDPEIYFPVTEASPRWCSEVAFIGKYAQRSRRHGLREALARSVAPHFDLKLYGEGWGDLGLAPAALQVHPPQYREICRGAKIVLGSDWRDDCAGYFSNRTWFTLGCGGFLLTNYVPELEHVFENHGHLVWYHSVEECVDLIRHYLERPEERQRIARRGHAFARAHRTYDHFARDVVDLVEGREPSFPPRRERASAPG